MIDDKIALEEIISSNYGECQCHRETMKLAADALRAQQERENPKPLTLDELREMGETDWVWLTFPELTPEESGWYRAKRTYMIYSHEHYGKTWLAYRYKPKEAQS